MTNARPGWHEHVFFGLHYDLHANAGDTELGRELTHEHLRERLQRVKPDWVQCDCKGHAGYTSWPTRIGSTSPGVVKDGLRIHRDVTRELGIKLGMHYSGVWDSRAIELHPEWARIDAQGQADKDSTCPLSAYTDELQIPQMLELIDSYDVDGFWVDGENWASRPCWCERCTAEYGRRTGTTAIPQRAGDDGWDAWLAFHRDLFVAHVTKYADAVHRRKPECMVCSNWMYTVRQPDAVTAPVDYISGDYDHAWGPNRAAIEARVIDGRGMSWDLMAWGFTKTGTMQDNPPWTMKPLPHLQQEVAEVVALGGAIMVYNQPQRTGWLTGWHQDLLGEVAAFCRARQDTCWKSTTVPEAAVLHHHAHFYAHNDPLFNYGQSARPVEGALHALLETQRSTDILTEDGALARMQAYKLVIVPEQTRLSAALVAALQAYAAAGGHVIMSGAHLARDYPGLVGATPRGEPVADGVYLPVDGRAVSVSPGWQPVTPAEGTEVWTTLLRGQEPEKDTSDEASVTRRGVGDGTIVGIHGPIFGDYGIGHYPDVRRFIAGLIDRLGVRWTATVEAPPRLELILRQKDGRLLVNLVNRGAAETLSPQRVIVEDLLPVENVVIHIHRDAQPVAVSVVPDGTAMNWSFADGMLEVRLPRVEIHTVVVIEEPK